MGFELTEIDEEVDENDMVSVAMIGPVPGTWGGRARGGGVATHVAGLVPELIKHGVKVRLLADNIVARSENFEEFHTSDLQVMRMIRPKGVGMVQDLFNLGPDRLLRYTKRIQSISGLYSNIPLSYRIKFIGQSANQERFLQLDDQQIVHVHHAEIRQFISQQLVGLKIPLVATVHGIHSLTNEQLSWLYPIIVENYQKADWLIAVSNFVKEMIIDHGANPKNITVIPNGIDAKKFTWGSMRKARQKLDLPQHQFLALYVGGLIPLKGIEVLIAALKHLIDHGSDIQLILVGEGQIRNQIENSTIEMGIYDNIYFAGSLNHEDIPAFYRACDVLVLPSFREGFGLTALEAMSCGRPVIVTRPEKGQHDFVDHGQTGFIVDYGDVEQLSKHINILIENQSIGNEMGESARITVEKHFTWDIVASKTADLYRFLVQGQYSKH